MLERETELIKQLMIESTINGRPAIRLNEIMAANLPRGVKTFMSAEVLAKLEEDFRQSPTLSEIAKGITTTVTGERSLLRSLAMEYALPHDDYLKLVEDTVHFLENYLCRPQWTLNQLMFETQQTVPSESIIKKFERIVDYSYFGMLVERHVRRKELQEMDAAQFRLLIEKIDAEVVKSHSPRELALLTKPIFEFLLFGEMSLTRPIPLAPVLLFYDDKKMAHVKDYIERICHVRSRSQISMSELIGIIEDLYHVETTVKEEVQKSEDEILNPIERTAAPIEESQTSLNDSPEELHTETAQEIEPAPDEQTVSSSNETLTDIEQGVEKASISDEPSSSSAGENTVPGEEPAIEVTHIDRTTLENDIPHVDVPLQPIVNPDDLVAYAAEREAQRFASFLTFPEPPAKEQPARKLPDLNNMLTDAQRSRFVSTIFKNDENACFVFLASLNAAKSWRDAQPYLRDLFKMNKLSLTSPHVIEFTDAMQARFESELRKA